MIHTKFIGIGLHIITIKLGHTFVENHRFKVVEKKFLRRILESKGLEGIGELRNLHSDELYTLYSSPDIVRIIKQRRLKWKVKVAGVGKCIGLHVQHFG
jgi:hypothetical protein